LLYPGSPRAGRILTSQTSGVLIALTAILCWLLSLSRIHPYSDGVGAAGLISVLPLVWWLSLGLAVVACSVSLFWATDRSRGPIVAIVALLLILQGTLPAVESVPRFAPAYTIAGFSGLIATSGHTFPLLDARMSWPGLMAAAGMVADALGISPEAFLRWTPLVLNILYLLPLMGICKRYLRWPAAQWGALIIFIAGQWIDQDYFSPQGFTLLLYLVAIDVVLARFVSRRARFSGKSMAKRLNAAIRPVHEWMLQHLRMRNVSFIVDPSATRVEGALDKRYSYVAVTAVLAISAATVVSHQLTPIALLIVLTLLVLVRRLTVSGLPWLLAIAVGAWISWAARPFWSGHFKALFGNVGNVTGTINTSVGARLQSQLIGRTLVVESRALVTGILVIAAIVSIVWQRKKGIDVLDLVILCGAPVLLVAGNVYGGEIVIRVLFFALAPISIAIAGLLDRFKKAWTIVSFGIVLILLVGLFPLARYGNESFEAISPGDLASAMWIFQHVPKGARILVPDAPENGPLQLERTNDLRVVNMDPFASVSSLRSQLVDSKRESWVYLSRSELQWGTYFLGYRKGWYEKFQGNLLATGRVELVLRTPTSVVYRVRSGAVN
jgi:hypothetical protein